MLPRILLIHGLNNNLAGFEALKKALEAFGFDTELITLPGHKDDREEAFHAEKGLEIFGNNLMPFVERPYVVIAFSQGARYFLKWLNQTNHPRPLAQVFLSPAFFIKKPKQLSFLSRYLPQKMKIPSLAPKELRRYPYLFIGEYKALFAKSLGENELRFLKQIQTLILIDPKDEVVDAKVLKNFCGDQVQWVKREKILKKSFGHHHILFHPDYFKEDEWEKFLLTIHQFLSKINLEA